MGHSEQAQRRFRIWLMVGWTLNQVQGDDLFVGGDDGVFVGRVMAFFGDGMTMFLCLVAVHDSTSLIRHSEQAQRRFRIWLMVE
ncbi:hypothetical protein [Vibrio olivae]|uniref:Uncharacterized protein n=1 Tax=Vibrio olivae TaxID=1243002 RepID=A0ABV5HQA1_9VIBR